MNRYFIPVILLIIFLFSSCIFQRKNRLIPIPDSDFPDFSLPVDMQNIIESQNRTLPLWLRAYITGRTEEAERIETYSDKYLFIGMSEGLNFTAMEKWAQNFSAERDTAILSAGRIENRLISAASLYPDDEYGLFFESLVKSAYSTAYPGAVKEDTHWIKINYDNTESFLYVFYVLISIDKEILQTAVQKMIAEALRKSSSLSSSQRNAINRLRDNFFEGF